MTRIDSVSLDLIDSSRDDLGFQFEFGKVEQPVSGLGQEVFGIGVNHDAGLEQAIDPIEGLVPASQLGEGNGVVERAIGFASGTDEIGVVHASTVPGPIEASESSEDKLSAKWLPQSEDVQTYSLGQCAAWAAAHQQEYPHLRFGLDWQRLTPDHDNYDWEDEDEDDPQDQWQVQHVFTHDDKNAYDAEGVHPLPYKRWDDVTLNHTLPEMESTGMLERGHMPEPQWVKTYAPDPHRYQSSVDSSHTSENSPSTLPIAPNQCTPHVRMTHTNTASTQADSPAAELIAYLSANSASTHSRYRAKRVWSAPCVNTPSDLANSANASAHSSVSMPSDVSSWVLDAYSRPSFREFPMVLGIREPIEKSAESFRKSLALIGSHKLGSPAGEGPVVSNRGPATEESWKFSGDQYTHNYNGVTVKDWNIADPWGEDPWGTRRPVVYHPNTHELWIGSPGSTHGDMWNLGGEQGNIDAYGSHHLGDGYGPDAYDPGEYEKLLAAKDALAQHYQKHYQHRVIEPPSLLSSWKFAEENPYYYHRTHPRNRDSIMQNGLWANWDPEVDQEPGVFMTRTPDDLRYDDDEEPFKQDIWQIDSRGLSVKKDPWEEANHIKELGLPPLYEQAGGSWYIPHDVPASAIKLHSFDPEHLGSHKKEAADYWYHKAPFTERNRILQHGLIPGKPIHSERWTDLQIPTKSLEAQPEGIYVSDSERGFPMADGKYDVWRMPKDIPAIKDRRADNSWVVQQPVTPELHIPYEHSNFAPDDIARQFYDQGILPEGMDEMWGFPMEWVINAEKRGVPSHYEDYMKQQGIGLPDRVIGKTGMAADPHWLDNWIERNGPYLYHSTTQPEHLESILQNGLIPWDHPDNPAGSPFQNHLSLEPRPGHVYLRPKVPQRLHPYTVGVDLRKLDPELLNPDEDNMVGPDARRMWGFPKMEPGERGGEWAELHDMTNPSQTAWSLEGMHGPPTIAYRGVIPPEAIHRAVFDKVASEEPEEEPDPVLDDEIIEPEEPVEEPVVEVPEEKKPVKLIVRRDANGRLAAIEDASNPDNGPNRRLIVRRDANGNIESIEEDQEI